jgi:hypothetical protein
MFGARCLAQTLFKCPGKNLSLGAHSVQYRHCSCWAAEFFVVRTPTGQPNWVAKAALITTNSEREKRLGNVKRMLAEAMADTGLAMSREKFSQGVISNTVPQEPLG